MPYCPLSSVLQLLHGEDLLQSDSHFDCVSKVPLQRRTKASGLTDSHTIRSSILHSSDPCLTSACESSALWCFSHSHSTFLKLRQTVLIGSTLTQNRTFLHIQVHIVCTYTTTLKHLAPLCICLHEHRRAEPWSAFSNTPTQTRRGDSEDAEAMIAPTERQ